MKVTAAGSAGGPSGSRSARAAADGFAPVSAGAAESAAPAARASATGAVNSVEALLALQETLGPLERRRRAVRRAGGILDALNEIKLGMLEETDVGDALGRLQSAVGELRGETDDPPLEDLLDQIEIRAAVELAKREAVTRPDRSQLRRGA